MSAPAVRMSSISTAVFIPHVALLAQHLTWMIYRHCQYLRKGLGLIHHVAGLVVD